MPRPVINPIKTAFLATYPPKKCGIGTFTNDLFNAIAELYTPEVAKTSLKVLALNHKNEYYDYPNEVRFVIHNNVINDYREVARYINLSSSQLISLQHEYGIFGGEDGINILEFLEMVNKPVVPTLHTILKNPTPGQKDVLAKICDLSSSVVVQSKLGEKILHEVYGVPEKKIELIYHGAPDVPFLDPSYYKEQFQVEGRFVILTFGLVSPGKGIEYAIQGMRKVVDKHPNAVYIVLGATHPEVKKQFGEQYRIHLETLVKENNLSDNVIFYNRFVRNDELIRFLIAADVFLTPYLSKEQIVSGTLTQAVACGKAVVSTPYYYAEEILKYEKGLLVPFKDSDAIGEALNKIIEDEYLRNRMRKNAYQFGRELIWSESSKNYVRVFSKSLKSYGSQIVSKKKIDSNETATRLFSMPDINLNHLKQMTDSTGLLQHAYYSIPNRFYGYSTDDNVRALILTVLNWTLFKDDSILPLMKTYLSFIHYAFNPKNGSVRNFLSYERKWIEAKGSDDAQSRTIWALGYLIAYAPDDDILALATQLFKDAINHIKNTFSPRSCAFQILGCSFYLKKFGGDTNVKKLVEKYTKYLYDMFKKNKSQNWFWLEDFVTYDNARIPQALIVGGTTVDNKIYVDTGLKALEWLIQIQTDTPDGHFSLVGNDGWLKKGKDKADFAQQPLEIAAIIDAAYEAYVYNQDKKWLDILEKSFYWFLGNNDLDVNLYNYSTGGCYDGLESTGVNKNQGAESLLSFLLSQHRIYKIFGYKNI